MPITPDYEELYPDIFAKVLTILASSDYTITFDKSADRVVRCRVQCAPTISIETHGNTASKALRGALPIIISLTEATLRENPQQSFAPHDMNAVLDAAAIPRKTVNTASIPPIPYEQEREV